MWVAIISMTTLNAVVVSGGVPRIVMGMWILGSCVEYFDSL